MSDAARSLDLLLLEYERSSEFANHVDDVRNVITSFFVTLVAAALVALTSYAEGQLQDSRLGSARLVVIAVCLFVAGIGGLFVATIGRLRRVQLQRYTIMNRILDECLIEDHRKCVPFDNAHLAGASPAGLSKRTTGSYLWTLILVLPCAMLLGIATWVVTAAILSTTAYLLPISCVVAMAGIALLDRLYFRLSAYEASQR